MRNEEYMTGILPILSYNNENSQACVLSIIYDNN